MEFEEDKDIDKEEKIPEIVELPELHKRDSIPETFEIDF